MKIEQQHIDRADKAKAKDNYDYAFDCPLAQVINPNRVHRVEVWKHFADLDVGVLISGGRALTNRIHPDLANYMWSWHMGDTTFMPCSIEKTSDHVYIFTEPPTNLQEVLNEVNSQP